MAVVAIAPAFAVDVTYSTTGTFASSGTSTYMGPNGLTITFAGTPASFPNVSVPPASFAPFGTFTAVGPTPGNTDSVLDAFTLNVTQSAPAPGGTETLTDTVSGNIKIANSQVTVVFNSGSGAGGSAVSATDPLNGLAALQFTFPSASGAIVYYVDETTPIHPQTGSGVPGSSIINGAIDLPEPTFYTLTGSGFAALLLMTLRRRKQNA